MLCSRREDAPELMRDSKEQRKQEGERTKKGEFLIQGSLFWQAMCIKALGEEESKDSIVFKERLINEGLKLNQNPVSSQDVACGLCLLRGPQGLAVVGWGQGGGEETPLPSVPLARELSLWRHLLVKNGGSQLEREAGQMAFFPLRSLTSASQEREAISGYSGNF